MAWGAPFAQPVLTPQRGLSNEHMEKHIIEWTALSQKVGYHTGLSTQVHRLLLQEPLDRVMEVLDSMYKRKIAGLYYCGRTRALWPVRGVTSMQSTLSSFGSMLAFSYEEARVEAIRLATEYPDMASDGYGPPNLAQMGYVLGRLNLPKRAEGRMTDETCVYCNARA